MLGDTEKLHLAILHFFVLQVHLFLQADSSSKTKGVCAPFY